MSKQRGSRGTKIGRCNTCREAFTRTRPRQRKCKTCWRLNQFKCAEPKCRRVYKREGDIRVCPNCLPKVQKRFRKLAVPIVKVGEDGTIIPPKQTDKQTNALLTKIGTSMYRGQNLDIAVGTRNKRLILASDMIDSDQRGDDALDCEFSENAQDRAEAGDVPWGAELDAEILVEDEGAEAEPELDPEQVMEPANVPAELELTEELWLSGPDAIETERQLKLINWFLTSPPGHVHRRTGLHPMTIARMKTSLRTLCPELVAKAVATGTSQIIAEALLQQRNLRDLKADNDL